MRLEIVLCIVFCMFAVVCVAQGTEVSFCAYCSQNNEACSGDTKCTQYTLDTCFEIFNLCTGLSERLWGYISSDDATTYTVDVYQSQADCGNRTSGQPVQTACGNCITSFNGYVECEGGNLGLIIGITLGGVVVVCCCIAIIGVVVALVVYKKKKANYQMYQSS